MRRNLYDIPPRKPLPSEWARAALIAVILAPFAYLILVILMAY